MSTPAISALLALAVMFGGSGILGHPSPHRRPQQQSVESLLAEATIASRAYDYEKALALVEQAVALEPLHVDANLMLRSAHSRLGTMESAIGRFRLLRQQYPDSAVPYYLLGATNLGGPNSRELQRANLLEALRIDPTFADAAAVLSALSLTDRDYEGAERWARRAMDLDPGPDSTLRFVSALQRQARYREAIGMLQQLVAQYPDYLSGWIRLWSVRLAEQRGARGISAMIGRGDITPLLPEIEANRFRFMGSMRDMELLAGLLGRGGEAGQPLAAELWLAIAERYPEHPRAEVALVTAARNVDADAGLEILGRLIELYPESPLRYAAYGQMIDALIREERTDEAIALSQEVIGLPDGGFEELGSARTTTARSNRYGTSFACVGHKGWFDAAQRPMAPPPGLIMSVTSIAGRTYPTTFGNPTGVEAPISPRAAAAARSLLESECREPGILMYPGLLLGQNTSYRPLGIALIERALALHDEDVMRGVLNAADAGRLERQVAGLRGQLAAYYLADGRLDDAVALIDELTAAYGGGMSAIDRIAASIYDAAGRLEDAKVHYLRIVSSRSRDPAARDALDRIYRELGSDDIETFEADAAPRLSLRTVRAQRPPPLEIDMPLARLLEHELTLVVVWMPQFDPTRAQLNGLTEIGESFAERGVGTLSLAVAGSVRTALRELERVPAPEEPMLITFAELAALGIDELPMTLLVDASGRVLARQMSYGVDPAPWREQWRAVLEARVTRR